MTILEVKQSLTVSVFGTVMGLECRSTVELLMARRTRKWCGTAGGVGVRSPDVMRQVVDVSEQQTADGAHRLPQRPPRNIVRLPMPLQRRPRPEPTRTDSADKRGLDAGLGMRHSAVGVEGRLAVGLVSALVTDEPVAGVHDRHVFCQLSRDEE